MEFDDIPAFPKLIEDEMLFCETGTLLALNFTRTCTAAIEQAGVLEDIEIRCAVDLALDSLLEHRGSCATCSLK